MGSRMGVECTTAHSTLHSTDQLVLALVTLAVSLMGQ